MEDVSVFETLGPSAWTKLIGPIVAIEVEDSPVAIEVEDSPVEDTLLEEGSPNLWFPPRRFPSKLELAMKMDLVRRDAKEATLKRLREKYPLHQASVDIKERSVKHIARLFALHSLRCAPGRVQG